MKEFFFFFFFIFCIECTCLLKKENKMLETKTMMFYENPINRGINPKQTTNIQNEWEEFINFSDLLHDLLLMRIFFFCFFVSIFSVVKTIIFFLFKLQILIFYQLICRFSYISIHLTIFFLFCFISLRFFFIINIHHSFAPTKLLILNHFFFCNSFSFYLSSIRNYYASF